MVEVDSELRPGPELEEVLVTLGEVSGGPPKRRHRFPVSADSGGQGGGFPFSFVIQRATTDVFRMRVVGRGPPPTGEGGLVDRVTAVRDVAFVSGETRRVEVTLPRRCLDVGCGEGLTCYGQAQAAVSAGACGPIAAAAERPMSEGAAQVIECVGADAPPCGSASGERAADCQVDSTDDCPDVRACDHLSGDCERCQLDGGADGHVSRDCGGDDCDDRESQSHVGQAERCDGEDNDCDGRIDEGAHSACQAPIGGTARCAGGQCQVRCPEDWVLSADGKRCAWQDDCLGIEVCGPFGRCVDGVRSFSCDCAPGDRAQPDGRACRPPTMFAPVRLTGPSFHRLQDMRFVAEVGVAAALWSGTERPGAGPALFGRWVGTEGVFQSLSRLGAGEGDARTLGIMAAAAVPGDRVTLRFVRDGQLHGGEFARDGFGSVRLWPDQPSGEVEILQVLANGGGHVLSLFGAREAFGASQVHLDLQGPGGEPLFEYSLGQIDLTAIYAGLDDVGRVLLVDGEARHWTYDGTAWESHGMDADLELPVAFGRGGVAVGGRQELSRFAFGQGFGPPEPVAPPIASANGAPAVTGVDRAGNILVVWADGSQVLSRRFDAARGSWGGTTTLPSHGEAPIENVQLAISAEGEALIALGSRAGAGLWALRWVPELGFSPPVHLFDGVDAAESGTRVLQVSLSLDDRGDGGLIFLTFSEAERYALWGALLR